MQTLIPANEVKKEIKPNEKQMECIKQTEGPVMVLAGPGTGKTFTVIQRIKYMIETAKIKPESILCLTYSEAAANEMKTRLISEVGSIGSSVAIHTYHAFCNEVIKYNPTDFELLDGISPADDITEQTLMSEAIKEYKPEFYVTRWGDSEYFVPELLENVSEIKKSRITKEDYFHNLNTHPIWQGRMNELEAEKKEREENGKALKTFMKTYETHKTKMGKAKEAWEIYEIYDIKLKQNNLIDFDDMINLVLDAFSSNDELLKRVSKQYKYFLVDEYQDTNYAQNNIVFKLAEGSGVDNIFVVGDDDQIIYEFQGAKTDTLAKFLKLYPQTKVICLNENNRSTQTILDFSYDVISADETRLESNPEFKNYNITKKLVAKNSDICKKDRKIKLHGFADTPQEYNYIVEDIEKLIQSDEFPKTKTGEPDLSSVAILARFNAELETFADLLKAKNIRYQIKITKSIFEMKPSLLVYFYLKALYNHHNNSDKLFGLIGAEPFDFEPEDYSFLLSQNRLNHKDFIENIRLNPDHMWADKKKVKNFITTFDRLKSLQGTENLKNLVYAVCNETGILDYFVKSDVNRVENILSIKKIIEKAGTLKHINKSADLGDFIDYLDTALARNISINIDNDDYTQNAIQLVTLHSSKGRQFDYVYMPNLIASKWESRKNKNSIKLPIIDDYKFVDDDTAIKSEHLRLLYVGLTRTKYDLTLSYSTMDNGKTKEFTSYLSEAVKGHPELIDAHKHDMDKEDYALELFKSFKKVKYDYKGAFKDEVETRIKSFVFSPSTLNSYLKCPREFFYTYILKIPVYETGWDSANYGTAIHATLENTAIMLKSTGKYPSCDGFLAEFRSCLAKEEFETEDIRERFLKRGEASLEKLYPHFIETSADRLWEYEWKLDVVPIDNEIVKGKIDRIEKNEDGTFGLYDYKTGSAKSKTQIADGKDYENYLNQLRFYKLAFESQNQGAKVTQAGLLFVEEYDKNFYITLTDEDNEYIKTKILESYENIRSMHFEPCKDENNCQHCAYKHLCSLELF